MSLGSTEPGERGREGVALLGCGPRELGLLSRGWFALGFGDGFWFNTILAL